MPWLRGASRALGGHPAHRPSHLLPTQTHWLPLKRLHLKGEMEFKGRQEPGGCPALGTGWPVSCSAVAWEESQDPGGVLGGHGRAGAAPMDPGVCWVSAHLMAMAAPGGKPVQGLQRCQVGTAGDGETFARRALGRIALSFPARVRLKVMPASCIL